MPKSEEDPNEWNACCPVQLSDFDMWEELGQRNALKWRLSAAFQSGVVCRKFELDQVERVDFLRTAT